MVMASSEELVVEKGFEPGGIEGYPANRRAGLHDVGANRSQFLPQADHAHVPQCPLVAEDVQSEAVANFQASRLKWFKEVPVGLAAGLLAIETGKVGRHYVRFHAPPRKVLRQQVFQVTHALRECL